MKKIEKDGMIYYVHDFVCKELHDESPQSQLTQLADIVVSKATHKLVKCKTHLLDLVERHIELLYGQPPVEFILPKRNTDWDVVTELVVGMVNCAIAIKDSPDTKLESRITIGQITVLTTREYDVTYINVMAPRGFGKTSWLSTMFTRCDFSMTKKLYPYPLRYCEVLIEQPPHIMFVDEIMPVPVKNKSIVIRTSTPR